MYINDPYKSYNNPGSKKHQNKNSDFKETVSKPKNYNRIKCPVCKSALVTCNFSYIDIYNGRKFKRSTYECRSCSCQFERSKEVTNELDTSPNI